MTDKEIVKALEEHYRQVDAGYSTHLEYGGKGDEHEEKYIYMLRDALDLINRQQAEIERLKSSQDCEFMDFCGVPCEVMKRIVETEIDKLNAEKNDVMYYKDQIKAETIKEFAERLKEALVQENELYKSCAKNMLSEDFQRGYEEKNDSVIKHIDNLVNEMVGE